MTSESGRNVGLNLVFGYVGAKEDVAALTFQAVVLSLMGERWGEMIVVPEEADEMQTLVKHEMENVAEFSVPIVAEVGLGDNWRDLK